MIARILFFLILNIVSLIIPKIDWVMSKYPNSPEYIKAVDEYLNNPKDSTALENMQIEFEKIKY